MKPGNTPLVEVEGIFAKLECTNPCGSIKDRIAYYILKESERRGLLKKGMRIVEATSGNTGISMAYYAREMGYPITIVMPKNMTQERKEMIQNLGAELILCSSGNFLEAAAIRDELAKDRHYFNPDQFSNPLNVECHVETTGKEIVEQLKKLSRNADAFVAGVGTGGTLVGVSSALKDLNPNLRIVAVEPEESAVMSGGEPGEHGIAGIGDGFVPAIAQGEKDGLHEWIDEVVCVTTKTATEAAIGLQEKVGFCIGISSGANFVAAKELQSRFETVVTIFPDGFFKYQSQGLKYCGKGRCPYEQSRTNVLA